MSANYPDREKWLAVRATPSKLKRERLVHASVRVGKLPNGETKKVGVSYKRPADNDRS